MDSAIKVGSDRSTTDAMRGVPVRRPNRVRFAASAFRWPAAGAAGFGRGSGKVVAGRLFIGGDAMAAMTQTEADALVVRVKRIVAAYGGASPVLDEIRKYYTMVHACPEHGMMVALEAAIERVERMGR